MGSPFRGVFFHGKGRKNFLFTHEAPELRLIQTAFHART